MNAIKPPKNTLKLSPNYSKTFGIGSTSPSPPAFLLENVQTKAQKSHPKTFEFVLNPPSSFWDMSKRKQIFWGEGFPKV